MTLQEMTQLSELRDTVTNAVSGINKALASITSARNELANLGTTYASLSELATFDEIVALSETLAGDIDGLFSTSIATAPQIEG